MEITSLSKVSKLLHSKSGRETLKALISIGDPGSKFPSGFRNAPVACRLEFDDVCRGDSSHWLAPCEKDVERIIKFAEQLKGATGGRIIIHCFAGLSRSTAAGFIVNCVWLGPGKEEEAMHRTIQAASEKDKGICPNELMVEMADELLDRDGAMINTFVDFFVSAGGMY